MTVKELRDFINSIDSKHDDLKISVEHDKGKNHDYYEDIGTITDTYNDDDYFSLVVGVN